MLYNAVEYLTNVTEKDIFAKSQKDPSSYSDERNHKINQKKRCPNVSEYLKMLHEHGFRIQS